MRLSKSLIINITFSLLAVVVISMLAQEGFFKWPELASLDMSFRLKGSAPVDPNIIIVEISDSDIAKVGRWPWKRSWHAAITRALSDLGAREIYFDIIFAEPSDEEDDSVFEEAIKRSGRVYLPFAFQPPSPDINNAVLPIKRFSSSIKGTGAINISPESDGTLRNIPLIFLCKDNVYLHSALKVAMDYMGYTLAGIKPNMIVLSKDKDTITIPLNNNAQMLINWAGRWEHTFKHYSFLEVLAAYKDIRDNKTPSIDVSGFKDSICLVGMTSIGLYDIKPIPVQPEYPGIGILANAINNILLKNFIREVPVWINIVILYLLGIIPAFLIFGERPLRETIFVIITGSVYFIFNFILFKKGIRLELFTPLMGLFTSYSIVSIYNFVRISVERQSFFHMSVTDGLTNLYNIRYFKMLLETEILLAANDPDKKFSIVMCDADHFKKFNDTYGHQVGDLVLKSIAAVLKSSVRTLDIVARYGGEEMIVLLRGSSLRDAMHVAEKMRKNIESCIVRDEKNNYKVTVSLGVSTFAHGDTVDSIIKRADDGLYKAKESGRNRVESIEKPL